MGQGMVWLAGVVLAAGIGAGTASATIIQSSNFNGGLGSNFTINTGTGYTVTDSGAESAFTNVPGGNSMQLTDNGNATNGGATATSYLHLTSAEASDSLQISFDFEDLQAATDNYTMTLANFSGARDIIFNIWTGTSGSTSQISTNANTDNSSTVDLNTWYHATLYVPPSGSYTSGWGYKVVDTSGTVISQASGLGFKTMPPGAYDGIQFLFNSVTPTGQYNVDNVTVATPEPTAISLLALSGLGLLILKPRRRARA